MKNSELIELLAANATGDFLINVPGRGNITINCDDVTVIPISGSVVIHVPDSQTSSATLPAAHQASNRSAAPSAVGSSADK